MRDTTATSIIRYATIAALVLPIVFFLPVTQHITATPKLFALALAVIFIGSIWTVRLFTEGVAGVTFSHGSAALLGLSIASLPSLVFSATNRYEAVTNVYGPGALWALTLIVLAGSGALTARGRQTLLWAIFSVTGAVGLWSAYQGLGVGRALMPDVAWLADLLWNPTGSASGAIALLVIPLPMLIAEGIRAAKSEREGYAAVALVAGVLAVAGLGIIAWRFLPTVGANVLPLRYGWSIALDTFKDPLHAFTGVGAENFFPAFTAGRPIDMNRTALWDKSFSENASLILHGAVIYGGIGIIGMLFFARRTWKAMSSTWDRKLTAALAFAVAACMPPSFVLIPLIAAILVAMEPTEETRFPIAMPVNFGIAIVTATTLGLFGFMVARWWTAELLFAQSIASYGKTDGTTVYMLQNRAIKNNPHVARYYMAFSQTNIGMALTLVKETADAAATGSAAMLPKETELLVSQSVETAIRATKLAPNNVFPWLNLASVYQTLIGKADGADTWAAASLQKAVTLDPTNPVMRSNLGDLYFSLGRFDEAHQQYLTAVTLKPNAIGAKFALARTLAAKGMKTEAKEAFLDVKTLVVPGSPDADRIDAELKKLDADAPHPASNVQMPKAPAPITLPVR